MARGRTPCNLNKVPTTFADLSARLWVMRTHPTFLWRARCMFIDRIMQPRRPAILCRESVQTWRRQNATVWHGPSVRGEAQMSGVDDDDDDTYSSMIVQAMRALVRVESTSSRDVSVTPAAPCARAPHSIRPGGTRVDSARRCGVRRRSAARTRCASHIRARRRGGRGGVGVRGLPPHRPVVHGATSPAGIRGDPLRRPVRRRAVLRTRPPHLESRGRRLQGGRHLHGPPPDGRTEGPRALDGVRRTGDDVDAGALIGRTRRRHHRQHRPRAGRRSPGVERRRADANCAPDVVGRVVVHARACSVSRHGRRGGAARRRLSPAPAVSGKCPRRRRGDRVVRGGPRGSVASSSSVHDACPSAPQADHAHQLRAHPSAVRTATPPASPRRPAPRPRPLLRMASDCHRLQRRTPRRQARRRHVQQLTDGHAN